jgi:hypothetical protein
MARIDEKPLGGSLVAIGASLPGKWLFYDGVRVFVAAAKNPPPFDQNFTTAFNPAK